MLLNLRYFVKWIKHRHFFDGQISTSVSVITQEHLSETTGAELPTFCPVDRSGDVTVV